MRPECHSNWSSHPGCPVPDDHAPAPVVAAVAAVAVGDHFDPIAKMRRRSSCRQQHSTVEGEDNDNNRRRRCRQCSLAESTINK